MPSPRKKELMGELQTLLKERNNFIITTYSGLNVENITEIRKSIREQSGRMKVVKNNLFSRALQESPVHKEAAHQVKEVLEGPLAVTFANGDFSAVSKVIVKCGKEHEQLQVICGFLDGKMLGKEEVAAIATLPSRDEMLGIIGRGLNTPAQKIATGMNQIIAGLARGIKALGEKNG